MHLNDADYRRIKTFYETSLARFGPTSPEAVHWSSQLNQMVRLKILLEIGNISGHSLIDVGCGNGELCNFIKDSDNVAYTGIDIISEFIDIAKNRFPARNFELKDVFDVKETYDFVLASGALSFKVENNDNYYRDMIKKMYDISKIAVAFNMLDKSTHIDDDIYAAYSSDEIYDFCKTFCPQTKLVSGYLPQDFTIYLYK